MSRRRRPARVAPAGHAPTRHIPRLPPPCRCRPQTARNHLQLYALNVSSEALWRLPSGQDVRRINVYLSHSLHLDYGSVSIADLGGDAKSLLVALSNGTMQVFSWQGKVRLLPSWCRGAAGGAGCCGSCSSGASIRLRGRASVAVGCPEVAAVLWLFMPACRLVNVCLLRFSCLPFDAPAAVRPGQPIHCCL